MFYVIRYYLYKLRYVLLILLSISLLSVAVYYNRETLITYYEEYNNKVSLSPRKYKVVTMDKSKLDSLLAESPLLGSLSGNWAPSHLTEDEKEVYRKEVEKDPDRPYRITISWASGSLSSEDVNELIELISYHYNKKLTTSRYIMKLPTLEELKEYSQDKVYWTDDKGKLYINLFVQEVSPSNLEVKEYINTFELFYPGDGKVSIK